MSASLCSIPQSTFSITRRCGSSIRLTSSVPCGSGAFSDAWASVRAVSALTGDGVDAVWDDVSRFRAVLEASGAWTRRRAEQARAALWAEIGDGLLERFRAVPAIAARLAEIEREVTGGVRTPAAAARLLLAAFLDKDQDDG